MERLGYYALVALLFIRYSRLLEGYHTLRIPMLLLGFVTLVALVRGSIIRGLYHRLGGVFLALTFFVVLSVPFSVWPGGSAAFLTNQWFRTVLVFFVVVSYATTFSRVRTMIATIAVSFVIIGAKSTIVSSTRFGGTRAGGTDYTFGNPNDFAMAMLSAIPLCLWMALDKRSSVVVRLFFLGSIPALVYPMSQTGSRMMLLCTALFGGYVLLKLRGPRRILFIGAAAAMSIVAVATMPKTSLARLMTLFDGSVVSGSASTATGDDAAQQAMESAALSSSGRFHLLQQSITLAIQNPLFGVGAHMFSVAENGLAVKAGKRRGHWQVAHNSYTEIAAECGLFAFAAYMMFLVGAWKLFSSFEKLRSDDHRDWIHYNLFGWAIKGVMFVYLICSFFLSVGYGDMMPTIVALGIGAQFAVRRDQMAAAQANVVEPVQPAPLYGYGPEAIAYSTQTAVEGD